MNASALLTTEYIAERSNQRISMQVRTDILRNKFCTMVQIYPKSSFADLCSLSFSPKASWWPFGGIFFVCIYFDSVNKVCGTNFTC